MYEIKEKTETITKNDLKPILLVTQIALKKCDDQHSKHKLCTTILIKKENKRKIFT